MYGLSNGTIVRLKVTFSVLNLCNAHNSGNIVFYLHCVYK